MTEQEPIDDIIDAHHHLWDRSRFAQPWIDPATMGAIDHDFGLPDLEPLARAAGVGGTVLVHALPSIGETVYLLELAAGSDLIQGVVGWVDLTAADVPEQIERLRAGRGGEFLVGVRHLAQAESDPAHLDRTDLRQGVTALGGSGLVLDLVVHHHQMPGVVRLAADVPSTPMVLDHLGKPDLASGEIDAWARHIEELAALSSVTAKLSGLVTEADWSRWTPGDVQSAVDHALATFSPHRLMFGSDWPVLQLASDYATWVSTVRQLTASLDATGRRSLWAGTARRVYRLTGPNSATVPTHQDN